MEMMSQEAARAFAEKWLPAWTGNDPETLSRFYAEDCYYSDPAVPEGVEGRERLKGYFTKLLRKNPHWVWTQIEGIPMAGGFLNKWLAKIPTPTGVLQIIGVCLVQLNAEGLIARNEVYFDRVPWFQALQNSPAPIGV